MTILGASSGTVESSYEGCPFHATKSMGTKTEPTIHNHIVDIRRGDGDFNLKAEILTSLKPQKGMKSLPTLLLYNERGLQIYEEVSLGFRLG
jgi:hypothetical protein